MNLHWYKILLFGKDQSLSLSLCLSALLSVSSLTAVYCFENVYVEKQPVAWKEYSAEYRLKELQSKVLLVGKELKLVL